MQSPRTGVSVFEGQKRKRCNIWRWNPEAHVQRMRPSGLDISQSLCPQQPFFLFMAMLEIELRALHLLDRHLTTGPYSQPSSTFFYEERNHCELWCPHQVDDKRGTRPWAVCEEWSREVHERITGLSWFLIQNPRQRVENVPVGVATQKKVSSVVFSHWSVPGKPGWPLSSHSFFLLIYFFQSMKPRSNLWQTTCKIWSRRGGSWKSPRTHSVKSWPSSEPRVNTDFFVGVRCLA